MTNKYEPIVPSIVNDLRESGETFELLTAQDSNLNTEWIENNFPIASWGRIDWSKMPESFCTRYGGEHQELVTTFEKIVAERELEGTLVVSWSNALKLSLGISMEVLRKYAEDIFYEGPDTWICNEQDGWCIEHYHDGEICFGKCLKTK